MTFSRSADQLMEWDVNALDVAHDLLHGYRLLDHFDREPSFAFGFGLSYTTFSVSELRVERDNGGFKVLVQVTNSGDCRGAEVVQLYVTCTDSDVFRVPKELKAFGRTDLEAGESVDLELRISDSDLCYYDADRSDWVLESCSYEFCIGTSSAELPLSSLWDHDDTAWKLS